MERKTCVVNHSLEYVEDMKKVHTGDLLFFYKKEKKTNDNQETEHVIDDENCIESNLKLEAVYTLVKSSLSFIHVISGEILNWLASDISKYKLNGDIVNDTIEVFMYMRNNKKIKGAISSEIRNASNIEDIQPKNFTNSDENRMCYLWGIPQILKIKNKLEVEKNKLKPINPLKSIEINNALYNCQLGPFTNDGCSKLLKFSMDMYKDMGYIIKYRKIFHGDKMDNNNAESKNKQQPPHKNRHCKVNNQEDTVLRRIDIFYGLICQMLLDRAYERNYRSKIQNIFYDLKNSSCFFQCCFCLVYSRDNDPQRTKHDQTIEEMHFDVLSLYDNEEIVDILSALNELKINNNNNNEEIDDYINTNKVSVINKKEEEEEKSTFIGKNTNNKDKIILYDINFDTNIHSSWFYCGKKLTEVIHTKTFYHMYNVLNSFVICNILFTTYSDADANSFAKSHSFKNIQRIDSTKGNTSDNIVKSNSNTNTSIEPLDNSILSYNLRSNFYDDKEEEESFFICMTKYVSVPIREVINSISPKIHNQKEIKISFLKKNESFPSSCFCYSSSKAMGIDILLNDIEQI